MYNSQLHSSKTKNIYDHKKIPVSCFGFNLYTTNIVDIDTTALETSLIIQCKSELNGAIRNSILASTNTQIANIISPFVFSIIFQFSSSLFLKFWIIDKKSHPNETIKLYQTRVYGLSELPQISKGFTNANINENNRSVLDLYTSEVATAKIVLNIKNKNVVQIDNTLLSILSQIRYLHHRITK